MSFEKPDFERINKSSVEGDDIEPEKSSPEQLKEQGHLDKINDIFRELLDKVKDSPEAERQALEVLIVQMKQIAEQIKQSRDINHLYEMKKAMLKHWAEINELVKGDPEMLKVITQWGKKFAEEKVIYYDRINEVKDELIEKSQEIQETWSRMQINLGKSLALIKDPTLISKVNYLLEEINFKYDSTKDIINQVEATRGSGLEDFISHLNSVDTGLESSDLDLESATKFLQKLTTIIRAISERAFTEKEDWIKTDPSQPIELSKYKPIDKHPELNGILDNLVSESDKLSRGIRESSKIYKTTKKIRDTHFLELSAEGMAA